MLLLEVELVSNDLQGLREVLQTIRVFFCALVLINYGEDDLTFLNLRDGLRVNDTELLGREHVRVLSQALHLREEEVQASVLLGTIVDEALAAGCLLCHLFKFLNERDLALQISLQVFAIIIGEPIVIGRDIILDLLFLISRCFTISLQVEGEPLHLL